jgi:hypothetical protein
VMQSDIARREPPFDRAAERRASTPTIRIATALPAAWVVDALRETSSHTSMVPQRPPTQIRKPWPSRS